jgi:hypothetical protein
MTHYVMAHGKRIAVETLDTGTKPSKARQREAEAFVMVPLRRMMEVSGLVSKVSVVVWLVLVRLEWLARKNKRDAAEHPSFACPNGLMARCGISRMAKLRSLDELEAEGFIAVQRRGHRGAPIVTLIGG